MFVVIFNLQDLQTVFRKKTTPKEKEMCTTNWGRMRGDREGWMGQGKRGLQKTCQSDPPGCGCASDCFGLKLHFSDSL